MAEAAPTPPVRAPREERSSIRALVEPLAPEQQRIIELLYVHDLTHAQVAAVLGRSETAVRQTHKRARDRLRAIIEAQAD